MTYKVLSWASRRFEHEPTAAPVLPSFGPREVAMALVRFPLLAGAALLMLAGVASAQQAYAPRLPADVLDVSAPSVRVRGEPGEMRLLQQPCRSLATAETRRHVVNVAAQEWAFFGFSIVDEMDPATWARRPPAAAGRSGGAGPGVVRRFPAGRAEEAARVAASIAGYWAVTPEGAWIVGRQNEAWNGATGTGVRWVEPWSAAFISWVMCEAGLGGTAQFQRAVAHHVYIDQAIRARDGRAPQAAFVAYDVGETAITPGDLLCTAQRPMYRTLAERRRQTGAGARTHCDVVVSVDDERERLLAIGGNVRGTVALKVLPAVREAGRPLRPMDRSMIEGARSVFAHLKLRADPIDALALDGSPTIAALPCAVRAGAATQIADARVVAAGVRADRC
jgi:hypothetical protein